MIRMTVDSYFMLPTREDVIEDLCGGRLVVRTRPKMKHSKLQHRLVELLRSLAQGRGIAAAEVPFRALPEYELRGADVAFVSQDRWDRTGDEDNLHGSPEIVIEALSRSNTKAEMREKAALYLSTGCEEFWVVDPNRRTISVTNRNGVVGLYGAAGLYGVEDTVQVGVLGANIAVADVFR